MEVAMIVTFKAAAINGRNGIFNNATGDMDWPTFMLTTYINADGDNVVQHNAATGASIEITDDAYAELKSKYTSICRGDYVTING